MDSDWFFGWILNHFFFRSYFFLKKKVAPCSLGAGRQKNGNGLEEGLMLKYG